MRLFELEENIEKQHPIPFKSPDLSMEREARIDRAMKMGFDFNNILYHGTVHDFSNFDPRKSDSARNTGTPQGAVVLISYLRNDTI